MRKRDDRLVLQPTEEQQLRLKLAQLSCELRESDVACLDKGKHYARGFVPSPPAQYRRNLPVPLSLR